MRPIIAKAKAVLIIAAIVLAVSGCQSQKPIHKEQDIMHVKSTNNEKKKVIFVLVDSLMPQAVENGVKQNQLPTFKFLMEKGQYHNKMVSSYPTMSVTIDSSLLTGSYPDAHHVPGLVWYSEQEKRIVSYGTGPMEIMRQGVHTVLADALIRLNGEHLNKKLPTLYEELARRGLKSGSINGLVYRGNTKHRLKIPVWLQGSAALPAEIEVNGPDYLSMGTLSNLLDDLKEMPESIFSRIGLNNQFAIDTAAYLIQADKLPDFLYIYLPDLDQKIHRSGPSDQEAVLAGVKKVDQQLQQLLQSFGSLEKALAEAIIIVAGDSGMTPIHAKDANPVIDLSALLHEYQVYRHGDEITDHTDIVLAVNETMAYVYKLKENMSMEDLAKKISQDPRIDFISWKEKDYVHVIRSDSDKKLLFKPNGNLIDQYNQKWTIEQAGEVLDLKIDPKNRNISYGKYPDALRRLYGALHSHEGQFMIVGAKPGYELADRDSPTHKGGGGHGSLGEEESIVPLLISGTDKKPKYNRMIDLKDYLLELLVKPL